MGALPVAIPAGPSDQLFGRRHRQIVECSRFAGALKDLGVGADGGSVFRPLFFFTLGLETTQLSIAALIFPLLMALRKRPAFPRIWVPACSGLIAIAGLVWFVERTFLRGQ